jgi:hypothetical protein
MSQTSLKESKMRKEQEKKEGKSEEKECGPRRTLVTGSE